MKNAIVTTLKGVSAASLAYFIAHHLASGFDRIYLFFDDEREALEASGGLGPGVVATAHNEALRERWRRLPQWGFLHYFVDSEVMARQILNCAVATRMALEEGVSYLLHLDSDELFYSPDETARAHFQRLEASGLGQAVYPNYEAIPEALEIDNPFTQVTLFKVNRRALKGCAYTRAQKALIRATPQLRARFFNYYTNGKAAARVVKGLEPDGVHRFNVGSDLYESPLILHYPICGFEAFYRKYKTLGRFKDKWFSHWDIRHGGVSIRSIEPFHLEARDVVAMGLEPARAFYKERVLIEDASMITRLLEAGALERIRL